jgi:hypothetical protein
MSTALTSPDAADETDKLPSSAPRKSGPLLFARYVLAVMTNQMEVMELPPQFRAAVQGGDKWSFEL